MTVESIQATGWSSDAGRRRQRRRSAANIYGMRRTTVYLRDEQAAQLKRVAARCGRSEAELIREGVDRMLREIPVERPRPRLLLDSGDPTWADRTDEILAAGFGAEGGER